MRALSLVAMGSEDPITHDRVSGNTVIFYYSIMDTPKKKAMTEMEADANATKKRKEVKCIAI